MTIIKYTFQFVFCVLIAYTCLGQSNFGIGTTTPHKSAVLEIHSTTQGLLPPRMTEANRDAIDTPAAGLMLWCTNCGANGQLQVYNGSAWTNTMGGAPAPAEPLAIGDLYAGGIIFYLDASGEHGKVCATEDQATLHPWTTYDFISTQVPTPGAVSNTDGFTNTNAVVAQTGISAINTYASGLCRLYSATGDAAMMDWYLPSKEELNLMWTNLADSDGSGHNFGPNDPSNLGGFSTNVYWSSTEKDNHNAWIQSFFNGNQTYYNKSTTIRVRAVRAF